MKARLVTIVERRGQPGNHTQVATGERQLRFWCQGCHALHSVRVQLATRLNGVKDGPLWSWDGNLDAPTISPSVKCTWEYGDGEPAGCCHLFLKAGVIEYLGDCTHECKNLKVRLLDLPTWAE